MNNCILCGSQLINKLTLSFIFSFQPLTKKTICNQCRSNFELIDLNYACKGCSFSKVEKDYCFDCQKWLKTQTKETLNHTALYKYNQQAKNYMTKFKFQGDSALSNVFADEIKIYFKKFEQTHCIVPIPLSTASKIVRGFNQVELILQDAKIPYKNLLIHTSKEKKQSTKSRQERLETKQPFQINPIYKDKVQNIQKPFLVVDDVYTTGRTILYAKELLNESIRKESQKTRKYKEAIPAMSFSLFR